MLLYLCQPSFQALSVQALRKNFQEYFSPSRSEPGGTYENVLLLK